MEAETQVASRLERSSLKSWSILSGFIFSKVGSYLRERGQLSASR